MQIKVINIVLNDRIISSQDSELLIVETNVEEQTKATARFFRAWAGVKQILIQRGELMRVN